MPAEELIEDNAGCDGNERGIKFAPEIGSTLTLNCCESVLGRSILGLREVFNHFHWTGFKKIGSYCWCRSWLCEWPSCSQICSKRINDLFKVTALKVFIWSNPQLYWRLFPELYTPEYSRCAIPIIFKLPNLI